jgi:hypothetical protein
MRLEAALVLPEGWTAAPEVDRFEVPPMSDGHTVFTVEIPVNWDRGKPRVGLAADVLVDGKYLGQIAEGIVDINFA